MYSYVTDLCFKWWKRNQWCAVMFWDCKWQQRNMQTWKKRTFLCYCYAFCSQLHWEKDKSYLLFRTTVVYCSIMWTRMYEVIKFCHVFSSLAGLLFIWSITDTSCTLLIHMLCTCVLACYNNKFVCIVPAVNSPKYFYPQPK